MDEAAEARDHPPVCEAYLDIETTGLSRWYHSITVIGIYRCGGDDDEVVQLVGGDATEENLLKALEGVEHVYTYNGSRFDLPFIKACLGTDLAAEFRHRDLMYDCWRNRLYGGLKAVERRLGIPRELEGVNGEDAVVLWWRYLNEYDQDALNVLLQYNREDVVNLRALRDTLGSDWC